MVVVRPCISKITCCHQEVIARKTLADWTDDERVVYPSPPTLSMPKDDEADEEDDEDGNGSEHDDEPEDDEKSEHGGGPDKDATPKKKEDRESEDRESEDASDDRSKTPKVQANPNDSGLDASGSADGAGTGTVVRSSGLPLPTQLPSMELLERLADDLYAYSRELFRGLENMSMAMLDRVLSGFKKSGGRTREYIHETAAITMDFFSRARDMGDELESSKALKFRDAVDGMKESIRDLIR